jgi:hypothetical protein
MNAIKWYISKFPEALYPCNEETQQDYSTKVITGRQKMAESTVVICGIARDISKNIMATIARVERLGQMFKDYRVVIYENDSTDGTDIVLKEWESQNYKVKITSEKLGDIKYESSTDVERLVALADYRNNYLHHIFNGDTIVPDYIIVADLDLPGGWSYEGICNSFGYDHWSVMGSNGLLYGILEGSTDGEMRRVYYDSLAFRRKGHPEPHVSSDINAIVYNRGESPIQVDSCFGGLALYKSDAFRHGARYSGPDCDHVELHRLMLDTGIDGIYLNPSQIVLYSNVHYTIV